MPCSKCGGEPPPGQAFVLTAQGQLCPPCAGALGPRPTRCAACLNRQTPGDPRSRIRRVDTRDLCGYCAEATISTAARSGRKGWRR